MIGYYDLLDGGRFDWRLHQLHLERIQEMRKPVRCAHCNRIYDLGEIKEFGRNLDCMTWRCPGCKILVDDRPLNLLGTATRHIYELDKETGQPRRDHSEHPRSRDGYLP